MRRISRHRIFISLLLVSCTIHAQTQDNGEWIRGSLGLNWKPGVGANVMSSTNIDDFLEQIKTLKTVDYIQLHINGSGIQTPIHAAPLDVLEALHSTEWDPTLENNMVVPPASDGDNFMVWLKAIKAAGFRTQVYMNGANMMKRHVKKAPCTHLPQYDHPPAIPTISEVWKRYCDANFQDFIDSKATHTEQYDQSAVVQQGDTTGHPDRKYAFCYAEYVIKAYSERYGTLIDAWMFDGARNIEGQTGDEPLLYPGEPEHLEAYKAFADAAKAGNPDAIVCFNNGLGADDAVNNPYHAILYDDYTMGHPFNAGNLIGDKSGSFPTNYDQNFFLCTWIADHDGYVFSDGEDWQKGIIGHWDPPMSTTSWRAGNTPALSDDDFNLWNLTTLQGHGAVSWGLPIDDNPPLINDWGIAQLIQADEYLSINKSPGAPNWARQYTILPEAFVGRAYYAVLNEGFDFWDPEGLGITSLTAIGNGLPSWLKISKSTKDTTTWILYGIPDQPSSHIFSLRATDLDGDSDREVELKVLDNPGSFTNPGNGNPVWSELLHLPAADKFEDYSDIIVQGLDFYDFESDQLSISILKGPSWLEIEQVVQGIWKLNGYPPESARHHDTISLNLSDGVHSVSQDLQFIVNEPEDFRNVEIKAKANANYGVDSVAMMISDLQTAPDGLATFQVAIDVSPQEGKAILSGISGGDATEKSWGFGGDGRDDTKKFIFWGVNNDWADTINNIRIVNFDAGGGKLSLADFNSVYFDSVEIANAQTGDRDAVAIVIDKDTTDLFGKGIITEKIQTISMETVTGSDSITSFAIGIGGSPDKIRNKWSIEGIGVKYDMGLFHELDVMSENGSVNRIPNQTGFRHNSEVELIPFADEHYFFDGWQGDTAGSVLKGDTLIIVMDDDKSVTAKFNLKTYTLDITSENGIATASPDQNNYAEGTSVILTATPDSGYVFDAWSGDISDTAASVTVLMDSNKSITANFSQIPTWSLNVSANNGTVDMLPFQDVYAEGTSVILTATPDSGYVFDAWSGDVSDTAASVTVLMDSNKNITANFSRVTGISLVGSLSFIVYPNPSNGHFFIKGLEPIEYDFSILSLCGKTIKKGTFSDQIKIGLNEYSAGTYLLKVWNKKNVDVKILILE